GFRSPIAPTSCRTCSCQSRCASSTSNAATTRASKAPPPTASSDSFRSRSTKRSRRSNSSDGDPSALIPLPSYLTGFAYMPARPTWKGYLKISLVNIPVKVFPATDAAATLSFNQLHAECQTRIQQKRWCPHCQREVPNTDIVKGYEFEKGRYVVVEEEDIEK